MVVFPSTVNLGQVLGWVKVVTSSLVQPSHPLTYHPFRLFNVPTPCLHERSQLRPLHNTMVRRPANPKHEPPLALSIPPLDVPHPPRASQSDNRNPAARHEQGHRALARADGAYVAHRERPPAPRELRWRERAGHLPPEIREVLDSRSEAVNRVRVYCTDGRRV